MKGIITVLALFIVGALAYSLFRPPNPPPQVTPAEVAQMESGVRQAIAERLDAYEGIATSGDLEGWWSYWTPDARVMEPGMDMNGADLYDMAEEFWGSGGKVSSADWEIQELFVHGDVAYVIGEVHEAFQYAGEGPAENHSHFFTRWERQPDGVWKISRYLSGPIDALPGG